MVDRSRSQERSPRTRASCLQAIPRSSASGRQVPGDSNTSSSLMDVTPVPAVTINAPALLNRAGNALQARTFPPVVDTPNFDQSSSPGTGSISPYSTASHRGSGFLVACDRSQGMLAGAHMGTTNFPSPVGPNRSNEVMVLFSPDAQRQLDPITPLRLRSSYLQNHGYGMESITPMFTPTPTVYGPGSFNMVGSLATSSSSPATHPPSNDDETRKSVQYLEMIHKKELESAITEASAAASKAECEARALAVECVAASQIDAASRVASADIAMQSACAAATSAQLAE